MDSIEVHFIWSPLMPLILAKTASEHCLYVKSCQTNYNSEHAKTAVDCFDREIKQFADAISKDRNFDRNIATTVYRFRQHAMFLLSLDLDQQKAKLSIDSITGMVDADLADVMSKNLAVNDEAGEASSSLRGEADHMEIG
jgi:nitrous oxide reductase